jgi:hypothetical protein
MEPLSATAAAIITGVLTQGVEGLARQVGEAASSAAQTIAQAVLDRLRQDPAETKTVERYEHAPERHEASVEAAIDDLMAADPQFAAKLEELVASYKQESQATRGGINVGGNVDGNVVQDNKGVVIKDNTGTIYSNTKPDPT